MEIPCGQKLIQTQRASTGKSFRSNPFLGSNKDKKGYILHSNVLVRFSARNTGKVHSILDGNGVLRILPGTGKSFLDGHLKAHHDLHATLELDQLPMNKSELPQQK
ncbi:hypothetical protein Ccrd_008924 [Cynara cardunculus var. scolymus]|uniref:Uncharacterized protein n=1 Tax=Cynara cardunculus var. scolymus TaxID=59895 RepID=A0A118JSR3_CYNCS|nr:hypothetical protein Ccrd_008924 [Cynara cardunculus var. scolymus]